MAEDSDGGGDQYIRTVITCNGDLRDPKFPETFKEIIRELRVLLCQGSDERLRVNKVEPWNSVRVTFTIPAEAAERLRSLAQLGDPTLARLGILSVQLAADQVISLRLGGAAAGGSGSEATASTSRQAQPPPAVAPAAGGPSSSDFPPPSPAPTPPFRSPNVVAPPPQVIPLLPSTAKPPVFPFASMTHAASAIHTRENQVVRSKVEESGSAFASVRTRPSFTPRYPGGQGGPPTPSAVSPLTAGGRPTLAFRPPAPTPPKRGPPPPSYPPTTSAPTLPPPQPLQQTLVNSTPSPIESMLGRKSPPVERESTPPPLTSSGKKRQYLINPLTGVLEPMSSDSSSESDSESAAPNSTTATDDLTSVTPAPPASVAPSSVFSDEDDDDDLTSTVSRRADTTTNEPPEAPPRPDPPKVMAQGPKPQNEKIKLRLKLEKNEPVQQAYKVESLFINTQKPSVDEPRVPPLHISLRGRNAAVVVSSRKDKKRLKLKKEPDLKLKKKHSEDESPTTTELPCVRNYPTEEEVASILRSMPPQGHKLLSQSVPTPADDKKREGKKRLWGGAGGRDRLTTPPMRDDKRKKPGSLLKSVVKSAAKEVRMMTAGRIPSAPSPMTTGKATTPTSQHLIPGRRDSNESTGVSTSLPPPTPPHLTNPGHLQKEHFQTGGGTLLRSKSLDGAPLVSDEFRAKVNCVYKGVSGGKGGGSPPPNGPPPLLTPKSQEIVTVGMVTLEKTRLPVTDLDISERKVKERLLEEPNPPITSDDRKRRIDDGNSVEGTNQGEDSGIESMDALSEKSPNQGESPGRKEDKANGGMEGGEVGGKEESGEDPIPIRLTPPLYTYSNPEKVGREETPSPSLDPSPSPLNDLNNEDDGDLFASRESRSSVNGGSGSGKSLLEQLLIEIPQDNLERRAITRNTRSQNNRLSTRSPDLCRVSPNGSMKRTRKASESSNASHDDPLTPRPSKRKCSENAAELIKACMGVDESKRELPSPSNSSSSSTSTTKTPTAKRKGGEGSSLDFETSDEEGTTPELRKLRDDQPLASPRLKKDDDKLSRRVGVLTTTASSPLTPTPTSRRSGRQSKGGTPMSPANGKSPAPVSPASTPSPVATPHDKSTPPSKSTPNPKPAPKPSPVKDQLVRRKTRSIAAGEESIGKRRRGSKEGK